MRPAPMHCPTCRTALVRPETATGLTCGACRCAYPIVGSIPILVADPTTYLCRALREVELARSRLGATLPEIDELRLTPALAFRSALLGRAASALRLNLALLDRQRTLLLESTRASDRTAFHARHLGERALARVPAKLRRRLGLATHATSESTYDFEGALDYLRNDWGETDAGHAQIGAVDEAVAESIERFCDPGGRAVYLGAALGRHAFDGGRRFGSVVGLELSFAAAGLVSMLREGPMRFSRLDWRGATTDEELLQLHSASFPPSPYGSNVEYVVGDALSMPLADGSVDAVVSIFFTDVVPMSKLLPEVRRVLRPGGALHQRRTAPLPLPPEGRSTHQGGGQARPRGHARLRLRAGRSLLRAALSRCTREPTKAVPRVELRRNASPLTARIPSPAGSEPVVQRRR